MRNLLIGALIAAILLIIGSRIVLPDIWNPPRASITSSSTILTGIKPLGQLVSIEAEVAKADITVHIREGLIDICRYSASHVSQATIRAGIDLTNLNEESIVYDEPTETYLITLPKAQLTSCSLDPVNTQQYWSTGQTPLCNVNWDEVRRLASYVAVNEFRDDTIENGLLDRAETEAELVISNFVKALTQKDVEIEFIESESKIPKTCDPDLPGRWRYDEEQEIWIVQ